MEKKELINFLNDLFKQFGFRKKGNIWFIETETIKKVINLQRSNFGNYYYLNYGWIIKALSVQGLYHFGGRLSSLNKFENMRIDELLDLDNNINKEKREYELFNFINLYLVEKLETINTEEDLSNYLHNLKHPLSNMIPGNVRNYFNIPLKKIK